MMLQSQLYFVSYQSFCLGVVVLDVPQGGPENAGVAGTWMEEWLLDVAVQNQLIE